MSCFIIAITTESQLAMLITVTPGDSYIHRKVGYNWFRLWAGTCSAPSHYHDQCCAVVCWYVRDQTTIEFELNCFSFLSRKCAWYMCMHPANERRRYIITPSLFGWAHTLRHHSINGDMNCVVHNQWISHCFPLSFETEINESQFAMVWPIGHMGPVTSETKLQLNSHKISFTRNIHFSQWMRLKFCTWHGNMTAVLYAKLQNDSSNKKEDMNKRTFARLLLIWISDESFFCYQILPSLQFYGHQIIINSLRPRQNGRHFADDIFKCIFLNENGWILIEISLKFVPKGLINNIPALV